MLENENILNKIRALFAIADAKTNLENASEAMQKAYESEASAALKLAHKLLEKYNLDRSSIIIEIEDNSPTINLPVMGRTVISYPFKKDSTWWKELAKIVAPSQFCRVGFGRNDSISFYGLDIDRELCIFQFEKFAEIANNLCKVEMKKAKNLAGDSVTDIKTGITESHPEWQGNSVFEASYHLGFRDSLKMIFDSEIIFNPIIEKLNKQVEMYFRIQSRMNEEERITETYSIYKTFSYAYQMGEKIGSRIASKVEKTKEEIKSDAITRNNSLVEIKFIGEVYLAIDTSGSMAGGTLDQARRGAIDYAYQAISRGWKVGLISFSNNGRLLCEPQKEIDERFMSAIEGLYASGFTNMVEAISISMYKLDPNGKKALCICTDGEPDSREKTLLAASQAKANEIEISCVGTDGANKEFLDQLASSKEMSFLVDNINFGEQIGKAALLLTA